MEGLVKLVTGMGRNLREGGCSLRVGLRRDSAQEVSERTHGRPSGRFAFLVEGFKVADLRKGWA